MKFAATFSSLVFLLPLLAPVSAQGDNQRGQGGNNNNGGNNNDGGNQGGNNQDPQTSLTLDPRVIAPGFANNGQDPPVAGQVASLTSTNNFINFCLTVPNLEITDGKQKQQGSCNPTPIGAIPSVDNMPSSKFSFPTNGGVVAPNTPFQIRMNIQNLVTGNFVNAQTNYFAAPQQLQGGTIVGHSHVVVELLTSIDQTTPTNPRQFAFFKGLNAPAAGGALTADVTDGLAAGVYRLCSINTAANHQPAIVPVAQHGALDDCIYFTAGDAPAQGNTGAGGNAGNGGNGGNNNAGNGGNNNNAGNGGNNNQTPPPQNNAGNNNGGGAAGGNLQTFTGALGGIAAPAVTANGNGTFQVQGNAINDLQSAKTRSCDVQNNLCADAANAQRNQNGLSVGACAAQQAQCIQQANAAGGRRRRSWGPARAQR